MGATHHSRTTGLGRLRGLFWRGFHQRFVKRDDEGSNPFPEVDPILSVGPGASLAPAAPTLGLGLSTQQT